ncbi:sodium:solute symporter family transporter, partial [Niveispirillum fermenti]|uniref:sodium:solute symporter family transporter n=1 Tax=Niveispirillum fermenti TaxID=1233113 RepID=UPI003A886D14
LVFAALIAAIIASTASKINSVATIFTLDLYAKARGINSKAEAGRGGHEKHLVLVGRIAAAVAVIMALAAARPLLGKSDQAFQFIQEFSGFFTPGITVIFMLGLFWKKANEAGAIAAAIASVVLSYALKMMMPEIPFMNRMGIVFLISLALAVVISLTFKGRGDANRISMQGISFTTPTTFNIAGIGVILILIALYATWW